MSILDTITADLDWREAEIASMRVLLSSSGTTPKQKKALLRGAWALLYAHYEGFCKNTLTAFYDAVASSGVACRELPQSMKVFALGKALTRIRNMSDEDVLKEITDFFPLHLCPMPEFPDVDTNCNLWPHVLVELMKIADLDVDKVREHKAKLTTLVSRRNSIAHGERNFVNEVEYYFTYEEAVYEVLYDLAIQIDAKLASTPFSARQRPRILGGYYI